jgi:hypothetical protein
MLLAPNGKPTNLTPEQYRLVRSKNFIDWFGDWSKDGLWQVCRKLTEDVELNVENFNIPRNKDPDWETRDFSETVDKMIRTSRDHILKDMDFECIGKDMDMLNTANTLMSVPAKNVKSMRNHTKAKLVDRRDAK